MDSHACRWRLDPGGSIYGFKWDAGRIKIETSGDWHFTHEKWWEYNLCWSLWRRVANIMPPGGRAISFRWVIFFSHSYSLLAWYTWINVVFHQVCLPLFSWSMWSSWSVFHGFLLLPSGMDVEKKYFFGIRAVPVSVWRLVVARSWPCQQGDCREGWGLWQNRGHISI